MKIEDVVHKNDFEFRSDDNLNCFMKIIGTFLSILEFYSCGICVICNGLMLSIIVFHFVFRFEYIWDDFHSQWDRPWLKI